MSAAPPTDETTKVLPKKGEEIEITIDSLAFGGQGVARMDGLVIFVPKGSALPGSTVRAVVTRRKRGFVEARPLEVLSPSPDAVDAPCRHFGVCGGCATQNLSYEAQLEQKQQQVADTFRRMGHFDDITIEPIIGCESIYHYRNKMEFTFSTRPWMVDMNDPPPDRALGLHVPGRYDKVLDIQSCDLQHPVATEILVWFKAHSAHLKPYDIKTHIGYLRYLVIRVARAGTDQLQVMVNIVTSHEKVDALKPLAEEMAAQFPQIVSVVNNVNTRKAAVAYGEWEVLLYGRPTMTEKLRGLEFEVSANAFFQTNPGQAEKLFERIEAAAGLNGKETVFDLYSGAGAIALMLARQAHEVVGFESVESAVDDAVRNAMTNEIFNARFIRANLEGPYFTQEGKRLFKQVGQPDLLVADPPRAGMHPKLVSDLLRLKAGKIVYISCNPATQVRDVRLLVDGGYQLTRIEPIDMFPQTPHIENICVLVR
ncbi:MAG: 23S rRNA (uracil(1939)-C(5))-methyltransferase RlmD [Candidatus Marinimicrobia bacterium]|nr:23S rRNA (uracil(1939)-C(5))-methyltransferase RlmD [Candidatus Neomarinimicrobiota bacterium]